MGLFYWCCVVLLVGVCKLWVCIDLSFVYMSITRLLVCLVVAVLFGFGCGLA